MANPALAPGALQVEKRVKTSAKADREVYAYVTERDGERCRVCGSVLGIERHHLRGRKYTTREDVVCLCSECHDGIHPRMGGQWLRLSGNADVPGGLVVELLGYDGKWRQAVRGR